MGSSIWFLARRLEKHSPELKSGCKKPRDRERNLVWKCALHLFPTFLGGVVDSIPFADWKPGSCWLETANCKYEQRQGEKVDYQNWAPGFTPVSLNWLTAAALWACHVPTKEVKTLSAALGAISDPSVHSVSCTGSCTSLSDKRVHLSQDSKIPLHFSLGSLWNCQSSKDPTDQEEVGRWVEAGKGWVKSGEP